MTEQLVTEPAAAAPIPAPIWRQRPAIIGLAVLLVAVIAGVWAATSSHSGIPVEGTITLTALQYADNTNPSEAQDGDSCNGFEGYADIAPGLTITIEGANGQPVGTALLQPGVMQSVGDVGGLQEGLCVLPFTTTVPSGQSQYAVSIPNRGAQEYTPAQLAAGVALTIDVSLG